jgi:hypothetical protein
MHNTPAALARIAPPADAQHVDEWVDVAGIGTTWGRYVAGSRRAAGGVEIVVVGWQDADGTVDRHASVWATDVQLDAATLRKLAALALDTADEIERLSGR